MRPVRHTAQVTLRFVRAFLRQPFYVAITLVQPVIWLLLFGALFKRVVEIPGFHAGSYIDYLTPGIVIMTALTSAGWAGMAFIDDIHRGIMDRLLVSPVWRPALNAGSVAYMALTIVLQSLVMIGLALAVGASFAGHVGGVAILVVIACLLGGAFAALSNAFSLIAREREALIGLVTMVTLPLTFLSSVFMPASLVPGWIRWIEHINPVNWAVEAGRAATSADVDWGLVAGRAGLLAALLVASCVLANTAFRAYRKSI